MKIYIPLDSAAVALGADDVAASIHSVMSLADRFAGGPSRPDYGPEAAAESGKQVEGQPELTLAS